MKPVPKTISLVSVVCEYTAFDLWILSLILPNRRLEKAKTQASVNLKVKWEVICNECGLSYL